MLNQLTTLRGRRYSHAQTNAKRIIDRVDLSRDTDPATYRIETEAGPKSITVKGTTRRVLETMRKAPLLAASPIRLGHFVHKLRALGLDIETVKRDSREEGEWRRLGVYHLRSIVSLTPDEEGCE